LIQRRNKPVSLSWSLSEVSAIPNVKQWLNLSPLIQRRNKPVSLSWSLSEVSAIPNVKQWLNLSPLGQRRKERLFPRLNFGPNETVYIPANRHVTWKFSFSSGVPVGYCLRDCLVIGWFKCFQDLQVNLGARGFPWSWLASCDFRLCLVTRLVTLLTFQWRCFYGDLR